MFIVHGKRGCHLEVVCLPSRALCVFSEVELLCCTGLVRSWNVLYSPMFIRGTSYFLVDSTSYKILRYLTIDNYNNKMGLFIGFYICSRDCFFLSAPWFVLAEDGYHGEVYYLERTLASGECRGLEGFWKLQKLLPRWRSVTNFFCERIPFGKRKFDLFDL